MDWLASRGQRRGLLCAKGGFTDSEVLSELIANWPVSVAPVFSAKWHRIAETPGDESPGFNCFDCLLLTDGFGGSDRTRCHMTSRWSERYPISLGSITAVL